VRGFKETVGVDGLKTLQAMRHLAFIYQVQGRDEEASDLLDHVLRFTERVFGPEHSETMGTVVERARLLKFQSRYAEAGPLFERVLIGLTKTLGANHIETLWTMSEFGDMKHRQGRLEEADSLITNSLAGFIVTAGREHYTTIWVRLSLGDLRLAQERYQDAQFHYKAALDSKEDVIGLWHERTVITRLTLWEFVLDRDLHCEEDEELCRRALKSLEEEHGLTNEFASRTAVVLLNILDSRGKNEEEEELARRWFGAYEEKYGLAHSDMKTKALYFAAVLHRHGRTEEEQALLERCRIAGFTPESWRKEWEEAHRKEEGGREVESDSKPPVSDNTEEGAPSHVPSLGSKSHSEPGLVQGFHLLLRAATEQRRQSEQTLGRQDFLDSLILCQWSRVRSQTVMLSAQAKADLVHQSAIAQPSPWSQLVRVPHKMGLPHSDPRFYQGLFRSMAPTLLSLYGST